jgi:BirA family biotin operon repressor/biotin-[acetyl-CoA-carboxylase] ligase
VSVIGARVLRYERVGSTMDEVTRLALAGEPEGTVVVAAEQTAGRGRAGRAWQAPPGSALLCSTLLRPQLAPADLGMLPLVAGVAVARAIEALGAGPAGLKWPNDVRVGGRKIAGVLMQSRVGAGGLEHVNLGIGINVVTPADRLPEGATSVLAITGRVVALAEVEAALMAELERTYRAFLAAGGHPDPGEWLARAEMLGEQVRVVDAGTEVAGVFVGITRDGALRLRQADGSERIVVAGDLTRGPRPVGGAVV